MATRNQRLSIAAEKDPELLTDRSKVNETLGHNPEYLLEVHGITKNDLIRLERKGLAVKARYEVSHPKTSFWNQLDSLISEHKPESPPVPRKCGTHRVRWIIFKEAVQWT